MSLMNIISILFWILIGVFFVWGVRFQYHEVIIGICALVIGIMQLIAALKSNE